MECGSPVDFDYTPPFRLTAKLSKVTVHLEGHP